MIIRVAIALAVGAAVLVLASTAGARSGDREGPFRGDTDGRISIRVVIRDGAPTRVRRVEVTNLDYACAGSAETGEKSIGFGTLRVRALPGRPGDYGFHDHFNSAGVTYRISGVMGARARRITGTVFYDFIGTGGAFCSSGSTANPHPGSFDAR